MGKNGSGKSTLGKVLLNSFEYNISEGSIKYDGKLLNDLETYEISRLGIYLLNQNPQSIEGVTNFDMLKLVEKSKNPNFNLLGFINELEDICAMLDLPESFIYRDINSGMSGGERKKNELLHMWVLKPKFIIFDEIDSGLDVDALKIVNSNILEYYKKYKPSVLIITHRLDIIEFLKPDYVHILKKGTIVQSGDSSLALKVSKEGFSWTY